MDRHTNKSVLYKVEDLHAFCVLSTYFFGRRQTGKGRKGERDWRLLNTYNMLVTGLYSLHMLLPLILTPRQRLPAKGLSGLESEVPSHQRGLPPMLRSYKRKVLLYREMSFGRIRLGGHPHVSDNEVQRRKKGMWARAQREAPRTSCQETPGNRLVALSGLVSSSAT